jgi:hypothetical protein
MMVHVDTQRDRRLVTWVTDEQLPFLGMYIYISSHSFQQIKRIVSNKLKGMVKWEQYGRNRYNIINYYYFL